jgi:hypothetical protein
MCANKIDEWTEKDNWLDVDWTIDGPNDDLAFGIVAFGEFKGEAYDLEPLQFFIENWGPLSEKKIESLGESLPLLSEIGDLLEEERDEEIFQLWLEKAKAYYDRVFGGDAESEGDEDEMDLEEFLSDDDLLAVDFGFTEDERESFSRKERAGFLGM